MSKEQIDHIRSKSRGSSNGPWVTDHDEMAKKSVIKRLCKLLPSNIKAIEVIHRASEIEDNSQYAYILKLILLFVKVCQGSKPILPANSIQLFRKVMRLYLRAL